MKKSHGTTQRKTSAGAGAADPRAVGFNPNSLPLQACLNRVKRAVDSLGFDPDKSIFTSRDKEAFALRKSLATRNVPKGFTKWQLPIIFDQAFMFVTVAPPNAMVPRHSHDEGPGVRFIASGSITYQGQELTSGDWMYIPKGRKYSFEVGPLGAVLFYCYSC